MVRTLAVYADLLPGGSLRLDLPVLLSPGHIPGTPPLFLRAYPGRFWRAPAEPYRLPQP